ncbi:MAG: sialate O-acetylesterase [Thiolinea sp.]
MAREMTFIMAGQSNMAGWTESKYHELPGWLKVKPRHVHFYQYGRLAEFHHQPGGRIGPEVAFSKFIAAWYPGRRINIVKLAVGGTSIYDWARVWNPRISFRMTESRIRNSLYGLLKRQITNSRVLDNNKQVTGIIWMQGERDAKFPQAANAYLGNIRSLIYDLRREYRSPQAPFILGRINPPDDHRPAVETIRRAQVTVSTQVPLTRWVNTDGLSKAADQVHYDTRGQIMLGRRFAEEFRRVYRS